MLSSSADHRKSEWRNHRADDRLFGFLLIQLLSVRWSLFHSQRCPRVLCLKWHGSEPILNSHRQSSTDRHDWSWCRDKVGSTVCKRSPWSLQSGPTLVLSQRIVRDCLTETLPGGFREGGTAGFIPIKTTHAETLIALRKAITTPSCFLIAWKEKLSSIKAVKTWTMHGSRRLINNTEGQTPRINLIRCVLWGWGKSNCFAIQLMTWSLTNFMTNRGPEMGSIIHLTLAQPLWRCRWWQGSMEGITTVKGPLEPGVLSNTIPSDPGVTILWKAS